MIRLTLKIRNMRPRTYTADLRMRESLDAFELASEWDEAKGDYSTDLVDRALKFVVRCFGNQFTEADLLDGYEGSLFALVPNLLREVISFVNDGMTDFPLKAATAPTQDRG